MKVRIEVKMNDAVEIYSRSVATIFSAWKSETIANCTKADKKNRCPSLFSAIILFTTVGLLGSLPFAAQAETRYSAAAGFYHTVGGNVPGTYATSEAGGSASSSIGPANGGTVEVSATSLGAPDNYNGMVAYGLIQYQIQFVGLSNVSVPVRVQARGYAQGSGAGYQADTFFSIAGTDFATVWAEALTSSSEPLVSFDFDQTVFFTSNKSFDVQILASASAEFRNGGGSAFAFVDPIFNIDPAYADSFRIVGVPAAVKAVPEPGVWALMIVGFVLIGSVMRRRGHKSS